MPETTTEKKSIKIGSIYNLYGDLYVFEDNGKYFWAIECEASVNDISEEIPKYLYDALIKFNQNGLAD